MSENRVQGNGYTYIPTKLNAGHRPLGKGQQFTYEATLARGQADAISQFQGAIDRVASLDIDVSGVQSAFDEIAPRIMTGDLTPDRATELRAALQSKVGRMPGTQSERETWGALMSLVNKSLSLHKICDDETDDLIEAKLFPAIHQLLDGLK